MMFYAALELGIAVLGLARHARAGASGTVVRGDRESRAGLLALVPAVRA
ncbi:hypothetical protein ACU4GD_07770 [Cupriavidus basilensis]